MGGQIRIKWTLGLTVFLLSSALLSNPQTESTLPVLPGAGAAPRKEVDEILAKVRQKNWKEVVERAEAVHRQSPADPEVLYWLGIAHLQLHEPIEAVSALRSAEKLGLHSALFHEGLGLAYYDLNQYFLFEQQMQKASQLDPDDSKPNYYLGLYQLMIRSDAARALELFQTATRLNPNDWKSMYQEGYCLEQLGKLDEARVRYTNAIVLVEKAGEHFGWPFQGMARLLMDDEPQRALVLAMKAVALEPNEPSSHLVVSGIYQRLGRLPEAIQEAKLATNMNPTDAKTRYALCKLYREVHDPKAADELRIFDEITRLYGSN